MSGLVGLCGICFELIYNDYLWLFCGGVMNKIQPDFEEIKKRLDVEEQSLRIEKMRRELRREDQKREVINRVRRLVNNSLKKRRVINGGVKEGASDLDERKVKYNCFVIVLMVSVWCVLAYIFLYAFFSGKLISGVSYDSRVVEKNSSSVLMSSPDIFKKNNLNGEALRSEPVGTSPYSNKENISLVDIKREQYCDAEYQQFLDSTESTDLGTFARLNKKAQERLEQCKFRR